MITENDGLPELKEPCQHATYSCTKISEAPLRHAYNSSIIASSSDFDIVKRLNLQRTTDIVPWEITTV